jgi:general stress protein YciG
MDKSVSIVKVDKRKYRTIAQENWGLTKEQMRGKHVHHRIKVSDGGTNDPANLYICSPWFHDVVWHGGSGGFIELAAEGGKASAKSLTPEQRSEHGRKGAEVSHAEKDENGKSKHAINMGKASAASRTPEQKREYGSKGAKAANASMSPEQRKERGKKAGREGGKARAASMTPEQISGISRKGAEVSHAEKDENGKSKHAINMGKASAASRTPEQRSEYGRKGAAAAQASRTPEQKIEYGRKGGKATSGQKWVDPNHPELGEHSARTLVQMQKRRGYPHGKENRVRVR